MGAQFAPYPPPFSLVICARNEAENLCKNLPAILAQIFENQWELIVVDDASQDKTPDILQGYKEKNPARLQVLRIDKKTSPGKKEALSLGIAVAKYDHLLLTDADCKPVGPHWLAHMAAMLTAKPETEIVLGYGPSMSSLWSRYETAFVAAQYFSFALAGMPYMGVGRNLAFKRTAFNRVGGFANHIHIPSGDDDLFINAAANSKNTVICIDPEAFVYSESPPALSDWLKQKQRHLAASPAYHWQHKIALAVLAVSHTGFYFLFVLLVFIGFNPMIVIGVFFIRLVSILLVFGRILRRLREPGLFWRIPLFDVLLAGYYGVIVPWILIPKQVVNWK
ncbi:MAG: glycosyltransferase [Saprospiraceae bacterium]